MLICDRFVFIHMHKTAGTWLNEILKASAPTDWNLYEVDGGEPDSHQAYESIPESHRHLPRLALVRNPYDWYVSMYSMWRNRYLTGVTGGSEEVRTPFGHPESEWDVGERAWGPLLVGAPGGPAGFQEAIQRGAFFPPNLAAAPFTDVLAELTGDEPTYYGYFESLVPDLCEFFDAIGVELPIEIVSAFSTRAPVNVSRRPRDWRPFYDDTTRGLVEHYDRKTLDVFDYTFEGLRHA
jgi:hypothetical protein